MELLLKSDKWISSEDVCVRGFVLDKSKILVGNELCFEVRSQVSKGNFKKWLKEAAGEFAFIIINPDYTILASDRIRSYPLFYSFDDGRWKVSDECHSLKNEKSKIDPAAIKSFLFSGYCQADYTLTREIFHLEAGHIIKLGKSGEKDKTRYFQYNAFETHTKTSDDLRSTLSNVFDDFIRILDGRQVAVSLSGGFDSRLVLAMLVDKGHSNILCFTYGRSSLKEISIARFVAQKNGCPLEAYSI